MLKKSSRLLIVILFIQLSAPCQMKSMKWGAVSKGDLQLDHCAFDDQAEALILDDQGYLQFIPEGTSLKRHIRVKILKPEGKQYADIQIPFYKTENIRKVKAQTISVDESGEIVYGEVEKKEIYTVDLNANWKAVRFTFPDVQENSILEYTYVKESNSYRYIEPWYFQSTIPTLRSRFSTAISGGRGYQVLYQGKLLTKKYGNKSTNYKWELENIPAIKREPFVGNFLDWKEKVTLRLGSGAVDAETRNTQDKAYYTAAWESVAENYLNFSSVTSYSKTDNSFEYLIQTIINNSSDDLNKAKNIYQYVRNDFNWNRIHSIIPNHERDDLVGLKSGNSASINFYLIHLLRASGLEAFPVLISTRSHGKIFKPFPFLDQFNHVIAVATIGEKQYFLDATDPLRNFHLLSEESLNGEGYVVNIDDLRWIEITTEEKSLEVFDIKIKVEDPKKINYSVNQKYYGYFGLQQRKKLKTPNYQTQLNDSIADQGFEIKSDTIMDLDNPEKPFSREWEIVKTEDDLNVSLVYLNPLILSGLEENIFKSESRQYPIDFGYGFRKVFTIQIDLPEGYVLDSSPESVRLMLPDRLGNFNYLIVPQEDKINISVNLRINSPVIPAQYYDELRTFYTEVASKVQETLVLKKN